MTDFTFDQLDGEVRAQVLARAFWALGSPMRMRLIEILSEEGETGAGELAGRIPVSQPQVSVHLKCLTDCGFLAVRREGRRSFYRIASPWVAGLLSLMRDHADAYCAELLNCAGCSPSYLPEYDEAAAAVAIRGRDKDSRHEVH